MTIFASILLGALWCFAAALIGYAVGADQKKVGETGWTIAVVLFFVTLFFVINLYS